MKIVHITYGFGLGGIETMLRNIANEQAKLEHSIYIIVINNYINNELRASLNENIKFYCLKREKGSKNPIPYIILNMLLRKINADIIHLHYSSITKFIFLLSLKRRLCVTQHDVCNRQNSANLYRSKRIYAISNIVKKDVFKWTGLNSEVVFNGINVSKIRCSAVRQTDIFRIVQVSRLMHEKKGQHILIKAFRQLIDRGYTQLHLDFIGDGESREYLENLVNELGLSEYISFLGAKDQSYIYTHLCEYDLYVQPSIYEGFGLTVAEAMAAKVPVLVSENQGPLEIIDYGKYGYSFKNMDVNDCADKIEFFLKRNNNDSMIEDAYKRVSELYNVRITAETYLEKYKEFIESDYAKIH